MTAAPGDRPVGGGPAAAPATGEADARGDWAAEAAAPMPLIEAIAVARAAVTELTGLPIDGIASTAPNGSGGWRVMVDVIESAARMGENDLLATYEIGLGADGALGSFHRARRYRREDTERETGT